MRSGALGTARYLNAMKSLRRAGRLRFVRKSWFRPAVQPELPSVALVPERNQRAKRLSTSTDVLARRGVGLPVVAVPIESSSSCGAAREARGEHGGAGDDAEGAVRLQHHSQSIIHPEPAFLCSQVIAANELTGVR